MNNLKIVRKNSEYNKYIKWFVVGKNCDLGYKTKKEAEEFISSVNKKRLEYLRGEIKTERISYSELLELQSLKKYIDRNDVELLEWAGVKEF